MALVFNSSPLSHFARAGRLAVLDRITSGHQRDIGEASVLAWAEINEGVAVIDERAGRYAAEQRGVAVDGTLWLIANGVKSGALLLVDAERVSLLRKGSRPARALKLL